MLQFSTHLARVRNPRWWLLAAFGGIAALLLYPAVERAAAPRLAPELRRVLMDTLSQRFSSPVTVTALQVRYDHGLLVQGSGLRIDSVLHGVAAEASKPMLRVSTFSFRTGLVSLLMPTPHLRDLRVQGVWLDLPPIAAKGSAAEGGRKIDLDSAMLDDVHVTFLSSDPNRAPLVFDFPHGELRGIHSGKAFGFSTSVDNGMPIGITQTTGMVGPWNFDDPRKTPVSGQFAFDDKDVSRVPGLHGRLTLHGTYQGTFAQMRAQGTTDDPAFGLSETGHTVTLHTRFSLLLDALASVVRIERVDAGFLHSAFTCSGEAIKSRSYPGYDITLHLQAPRVRLEDALLLAASTTPPLAHGDLDLQGTVQLHAGAQTVLHRLQLDPAEFHVQGMTFSSPALQQQVESMSERAKGHPNDANPQHASAAPVQAHGTLALKNAVLRFDRVTMIVPGAEATMSGQYVLPGAALQLSGTVHTQAEASQMTTGLKSLLAKPFNGLFAHGHKGATLPFSIQGTGSQMSFDVVLPGGKRIAAPGEHHR